MHIESSKQRNLSQPRSSSARPLAGHLTDVTLASEDGQLVTATRWSCLGRVPFSRTFLEIVTSSSFGLYERTDYGWMDKGEMIHTKRTWTRSSRDIEWNDWSTQTSGGSRKKSAYFCKTLVTLRFWSLLVHRQAYWRHQAPWASRGRNFPGSRLHGVPFFYWTILALKPI